VWYDRWSSIDADIIHVSYFDASTNNVIYRNIDAGNSDTLSTATTIFDGASLAAGSYMSLTRTRGGNIICGGCIDAGTELFCYKSTDVGANWTSIAAVAEANVDQLILLPGWGIDNQDAMCFFWDQSANQISRKLYDDSADSWNESSIASSMVMTTAATGFPHFSAAVDITNSQNLLAAWSAVDSANADLRFWKVTEGAITEVTNVVLNSTDDQAYCSVGIDINTNYWYVFYAGKSDGSETFGTAQNVYCKVSQDGGTTWGPETKLTNAQFNIKMVITSPRFINQFVVYLWCSTNNEIRINAPVLNPRATFQLGL
jgi:hypothetical protein